MTPRSKTYALALAAALTASLAFSPAQARDRDDNPPGPRGGPGTNWENPRGPAGGPGASPDRRHWRDRDDNPPGPRGGPGTNWENPPGPAGGPGASPDRRRVDRDDNPPGPRGGPGTNWENPPGPAGGRGASPDVRLRHTNWLRARMSAAEWTIFINLNFNEQANFCHRRGIARDYCWFDADYNPPGPVGGPGTNWENPPGPVGGRGASPDLRRRHTSWLRTRMTEAEWTIFLNLNLVEQQAFCHKRGIDRDYCWFDRDDNPPGPRGGPGTNWENPPGPVGGPGASPDRRY